MTTHSLKAEASVCNPYVVKFIVALGAMVSMILTVQLTTSFMAPDGGILALAVGGAFGLLLDISKVLFLIVGLTLRMRATTEAKKTAAGVLITFALILAATSVAATLSATLRADSGAHRTAVRESLEFKNLEAEREGIALDIAILRENARRDTQAGYRSRAKETLAQVKDLGVRYAFIGSSIQQMLEQGPGMKPSAVVLALSHIYLSHPGDQATAIHLPRIASRRCGPSGALPHGLPCSQSMDAGEQRVDTTREPAASASHAGQKGAPTA